MRQLRDDNDEYQHVYQLALTCVTRREYSVQALRQTLQQKVPNSPHIAAVIQVLIDKNYLSDSRFAEAYARMRWQRGYGLLHIKHELQQQGISADAIVEIAAKYMSDEHEHAEIVRRKKFGMALPHTMQKRAQQMRFLQYRGFSPELIKMVFRNDDER